MEENEPGALGHRISKCHKEKMAYFSKDLEGLQIEEKGPGDTEAKNRQM